MYVEHVNYTQHGNNVFLGEGGCGRKAVGFTTTTAISVYHCSWQGILNTIL